MTTWDSDRIRRFTDTVVGIMLGSMSSDKNDIRGLDNGLTYSMIECSLENDAGETDLILAKRMILDVVCL
jgi:hypothetical protein